MITRVKNALREQLEDIAYGVYQIYLDGEVVEDRYLFVTPEAMTINNFERSLNQADIDNLLSRMFRGTYDWNYTEKEFKPILVVGSDEEFKLDADFVNNVKTSLLNQASTELDNAQQLLEERYSNAEKCNDMLKPLNESVEAIVNKLEDLKEERESARIARTKDVVEKYIAEGIIDPNLPLYTDSENYYGVRKDLPGIKVGDMNTAIGNEIFSELKSLDDEIKNQEAEMYLTKGKIDEINKILERLESDILTLNQLQDRDLLFKDLISEYLGTKEDLYNTFLVNIENFIPSIKQDVKSQLLDYYRKSIPDVTLEQAFEYADPNTLLALSRFTKRKFVYSFDDFLRRDADVLALLVAKNLLGNIYLFFNLDNDKFDYLRSELYYKVGQNNALMLVVDNEPLCIPGSDLELLTYIDNDNRVKFATYEETPEIFDRGNMVLNQVFTGDENDYEIIVNTETLTVEIYVNQVATSADSNDVLKPLITSLKNYQGVKFSVIINNKLLTIPNSKTTMNLTFNHGRFEYTNAQTKAKFENGSVYLRRILNQSTIGKINISEYGRIGKYYIDINESLKIITIQTEALRNYVSVITSFKYKETETYKPMLRESEVTVNQREAINMTFDLTLALYSEFREGTFDFIVNKIRKTGALNHTAVGRLLSIRHAFTPIVIRMTNVVLPFDIPLILLQFMNHPQYEEFNRLKIPVGSIKGVELMFITKKEACELIKAKNYFKVNHMLLMDYILFKWIANIDFETRYILKSGIRSADTLLFDDNSAEDIENRRAVDGFAERCIATNRDYVGSVNKICKYLDLYR